MVLVKVSHLNIVDTSISNICKVAFTACPCFLACDMFKFNIENLLLLARSIQSLLASAKGNVMELYAFRQEVSRAYAICLLASALGKNLDYAFVL
jgi:hypothetical protein